MYVLGVGDVTHDVSVALVKNGKVVAACEYERLSRIKHGFQPIAKKFTIETQHQEFLALTKYWTPDVRAGKVKNCIDYCLEQENISLSDIDITTLSTLYDTPLSIKYDHIIKHHVAHSASAFYPSPFEKSAILTIDGCGEINNYHSESASYSVGEKQHMTTIKTLGCYFDLTEQEKKANYGFPLMTLNNTLGAFYLSMTILIGMQYLCEGKSMGLSAYGETNRIFDFLWDHVTLLPQGEFRLDNRGIFLKLSTHIQEAKWTLNDKELFQYYADAAYAHQKILETIIFHMCNYLYAETKLKQLCLAGGVALNSVANGKILQNTPFEEIFIQPAAGDNGISIGCALYGAHQLNNEPKYYNLKRQFSPFLGKTYSHENFGKKYSSLIAAPISNMTIHQQTARYIAEGKIVAWFNGRSEIGPRALGNRSILADPRNTEIKNILDNKIKYREHFRPYAPAVLAEYAEEYFDISTESAYMLLVAPVKKSKQKIIPAVTHINGSARLQTVSKSMNLDFYKLIKEFYNITNVPILLNTSLNVAGEPIIETPEEAIKCFLNSEIDVLMLDGYLYLKQNATKPVRSTQSLLASV